MLRCPDEQRGNDQQYAACCYLRPNEDLADYRFVLTLAGDLKSRCEPEEGR